MINIYILALGKCPRDEDFFFRIKVMSILGFVSSESKDFSVEEEIGKPSIALENIIFFHNELTSCMYTFEAFPCKCLGIPKFYKQDTNTKK